ncbi:MAG: DUF2303 family protein [Nitratireductor sp.]
MIPIFALQAAIEGARIADPVINGEHGKRHAFVPEGMTLQDISDPYALPPRIEQSLQTDDAQSLMTYTNRFSDTRSILIADVDALTVTAVLDWHFSNNGTFESTLNAQPCKHKATLKLRRSEEFKRWSAMEGILHDQMAFAEFLDENAQDIIDPDPADMIEVARELEATQGVAFKAATRLQTGERSLRYETETHTKGDIKVPTQFTLQIPLFQGEEPVDIKASFRFRPQPDGLKLGFVWRRVDYRIQAEFAQIATRVAENTGLPVMFGR